MEVSSLSPEGPTRRDLLRVAGALALGEAAGLATVRSIDATPAAMQAAIASVTGGAKVNSGRVKLDIPPLVENGNTVPCSITVDSPMTEADHVKAIHVFTEKKSAAERDQHAARPARRTGERIDRIRLADTQTVVAIAELSDGSFWSD